MLATGLTAKMQEKLDQLELYMCISIIIRTSLGNITSDGSLVSQATML